MKETDRICEQMKQMVYGEAWHGPCIIDVLRGITAPMASAKPIPGVHSIWEILAHLTATQQIILQRIRTGTDSGEDFPSAPAATDEAWENAIVAFKAAEHELRQAIAAFPDDRLSHALKVGGTSAYNNFHGNIQHTAYHISQIGLLKKMQQPHDVKSATPEL